MARIPGAKQINLTLSEEDFNLLTDISETHGLSKSEAIRQAVRFYKEYLDAEVDITAQVKKEFISKYLRTK